MSARRLAALFVVYLGFCAITDADILSDEYIDDHVTISRLPKTLDDGFTTKEGVEVEGTTHWTKTESELESALNLSPGTPLSSIHGWTYTKDSTISKLYPVEEDTRNIVRRSVKNALYSPVNTTGFKSKVLLAAASKDVLVKVMEMDPALAYTPEFLHVFSGNGILGGRQAHAHRYGGHQFGMWAGQLGDGRAHTIGEVTDSRGESWEVQLKGSGKTPYSRDGDGRAVIRSSVREFLASEAMHYLGVPTSRAGSLAVTHDRVRRDAFYDGNVKEERTAVVMRLAKSWLRFGTLELLAKNGEVNLLRTTLDTIIQEHYPKIPADDPDRVVKFYKKVYESTMMMVVRWMAVGFAHGVMNTDNFSLHGITIDYGPFRFLDEYSADTVPNTSDDEGRYAYSKQPEVARQNLEYLRDALQPLLSDEQTASVQKILDKWERQYEQEYITAFRKKLGIHHCQRDDIVDQYLIGLLLKIMEVGADFTMTFREFSEWPLDDIKQKPERVAEKHVNLQMLRGHKHWVHWLREVYLPKLMQYTRPEGFSDRRRYETFTKTYPNWSDSNRLNDMKVANPRYVLRNWMAQEAIAAAEHDDFEPLRALHDILRRPYSFQWEAETRGYAKPPPHWARDLKVSCSS